jgi:putative glutamine amidotransferase
MGGFMADKTEAPARPVIALCSKQDALGEYTQLSSYYVERVLAAGGLPFILPSHDTTPSLAHEVVSNVDGILFTGGVDVCEDSFGGCPYAGWCTHELGEGCKARDTFEDALIHAAWDADLPALGICRGMQVMNVSLGGTLVRDVTEQAQSQDVEILKHADLLTPFPYTDGPRHMVEIESRSRVSTILNVTETEVNSFHHLCVATPARGSRITAHATDGTPEAIEFPEKTFFLGVQWHPEIMGTQPELFEAFVSACRDRRNSRQR